MLNRPGEFGGPVLVSGGPPGVGGMGGPPFRQSPGREESDFSRHVFDSLISSISVNLYVTYSELLVIRIVHVTA